ALLRHTRKGIIRSGQARAIYVEALQRGRNSDRALVCVVPRGHPAGERITIAEPRFRALVNEPVQIRLHSSATRGDDAIGSMIPFGTPHINPLPPAETVLQLPRGVALPRDQRIDVQLSALLHETGVLELSCVHPERDDLRWQLRFQTRPSATADDAGQASSDDAADTSAARQLIRGVFGKGKERHPPAKSLRRELEEILGARENWSLGVLRSLWPELARGMTRKGRSPDHERSWYYLAGYCLRPGYGAALDGEYVSQLWRAFDLGLSFPGEASVLVQSLIMWRRIAGGLDAGQQEALFASLQKTLNAGKSPPLEALRLGCSLERLPLAEKTALGKRVVKLLTTKSLPGREQFLWELGRLSSRIMLYAPSHYVLPPEFPVRWLQRLVEEDWVRDELQNAPQIWIQALRRSADTEKNLAPDQIRWAQSLFASLGVAPESVALLEKYQEPALEDRRMLFGEALPHGLALA
ncbi:MAG: hypothetical protein KDD44_00465, partial [Bdellovibrionales bacterium]|nr:hypothetical protein [Bdellovibrionales bacterium]